MQTHSNKEMLTHSQVLAHFFMEVKLLIKLLHLYKFLKHVASLLVKNKKQIKKQVNKDFNMFWDNTPSNIEGNNRF